MSAPIEVTILTRRYLIGDVLIIVSVMDGEEGKTHPFWSVANSVDLRMETERQLGQRLDDRQWAYFRPQVLRKIGPYTLAEFVRR